LAGKQKRAFMCELGQPVALSDKRKALMAEVQALPNGYSSEEGQPNRQMVPDRQLRPSTRNVPKCGPSFEESQKRSDCSTGLRTLGSGLIRPHSTIWLPRCTMPSGPPFLAWRPPTTWTQRDWDSASTS
jgi:hypothetical protein